MNPDTVSNASPVATGVSSTAFAVALVGIGAAVAKHYGTPLSQQVEGYCVVVLTGVMHTVAMFLKPWLAKLLKGAPKAPEAVKAEPAAPVAPAQGA